MLEAPEYGMVPDKEMAGAAASSLTGALALGVRPVAVRRTSAPDPKLVAKKAAPLQLGRVCTCVGKRTAGMASDRTPAGMLQCRATSARSPLASWHSGCCYMPAPA